MDDRKYDTNIQNTQLEHELQKLKKSYVSQQMAKSQVEQLYQKIEKKKKKKDQSKMIEMKKNTMTKEEKER